LIELPVTAFGTVFPKTEELQKLVEACMVFLLEHTSSFQYFWCRLAILWTYFSYRQRFYRFLV